MAQLEEIKVERNRLDSREDTVTRRLANDHGQASKVWQLDKDNLGALSHLCSQRPHSTSLISNYCLSLAIPGAQTSLP